jgi:hypothetical protein
LRVALEGLAGHPRPGRNRMYDETTGRGCWNGTRSLISPGVKGSRADSQLGLVVRRLLELLETLAQ